MKLLRKALALEEEATGVLNNEQEIVFYARLSDFVELNRASVKEFQYQWEVKVAKTDKNASKGTIRVRKTIPNITGDAPPEYVLTTKTPNDVGDGRHEVAIPTTEDNFQQFMMIAERGQMKDRYNFPIGGTNIIFEVDMFYLPGAERGSGKYHPWCKIDIENVTSIDQVPELPFKVEELIKSQTGSRTPEEETKVNFLYDNMFNLKNQFL